jgi:hypothetical protein
VVLERRGQLSMTILASAPEEEISPSSDSSRSRALKLSMKPFSHLAAPFNGGCLGADGSDPVLHGLGDELRTVAGSEGLGNPAQNEETRQKTSMTSAELTARTRAV